VIHSDDWGGQDTIAVTGLGALTGTIDVLKAIAEGRGPSRYLIALGYAGWGEGQLDEEMTRPGWFAANGRQEILFDTPTAERWEASSKAEGIDPRLLDSAAGAA
jgi:putative transcriptional regulator